MDGISENKNREKYKMFFGITKFLYDNNIKKASIYFSEPSVIGFIFFIIIWKVLYDVTEITIENGTQMIQGKDFDILIMAEPVQK